MRTIPVLSGLRVLVSGALALSLLGCVEATSQMTTDNEARSAVPVFPQGEIVGAPAPVITNAPPVTTNAAAGTDVISAPAQPVPVELSATAVDPGAPGSAPALTNMSPALSEVVRLVQANVSEEVLLAYVENADFPTHPTVDEILYLNDLGVSDNVTKAVLARAGKTARPVEAAAVPVIPAPQPETAPAPAPVQAETAQVQAPPQQITTQYFYTALSPYGRWIDVEGYGLCWQPTVMVSNPAWQPYWDNGYWLSTDCGWYWYSNYSWGWAPFHYGRWHRSPRWGWIWSPDTHWGPSWVSWRYSDDYCGWAPLPPAAHYHSGIGFTYFESNVGIRFDFGLTPDCYSFVPMRHFHDAHFHRYRVSPHDRDSVYHHTTVNNHYYSGQHGVVNRGVPPEHVSKITKKEIKQLTLKDAPTPGRRGEVVDKRIKQLVVYRPQPALNNAPFTKLQSSKTPAAPTLAAPTRNLPDITPLPASGSMSPKPTIPKVITADKPKPEPAPGIVQIREKPNKSSVVGSNFAPLQERSPSSVKPAVTQPTPAHTVINNAPSPVRAAQPMPLFQQPVTIKKTPAAAPLISQGPLPSTPSVVNPPPIRTAPPAATATPTRSMPERITATRPSVVAAPPGSAISAPARPEPITPRITTPPASTPRVTPLPSPVYSAPRVESRSAPAPVYSAPRSEPRVIQVAPAPSAPVRRESASPQIRELKVDQRNSDTTGGFKKLDRR